MSSLVNSFWGASGAAANELIIKTISTLASWSPLQVTNGGSTLQWELTGAVTNSATADDPAFDLSTSGGGETVMSVIDVTQVTDFRNYNYTMGITEFDATGLIAITRLDLRGETSLTAIDLTKCVLLINLQMYNNTGLATLDVSQNTALTTIDVYNNALTELDVSNNTSLTTLNGWLNSIPLAGLTLTPSITALSIYSNPISGSLDLSALTVLLALDVHDCQLTGLTLGGSSITSAIIYGNASLTTVNISAHTSMTKLWAQSSGFTNGIDISSNTALNDIRVHFNNYTATATNQLLVDLDNAGVSSGSLRYRNNEDGTSGGLDGITARANLVTKSWSITNEAT